MLVSAILSGHLPPGAPVPSSRHLADHLRIARNTVVFAYQQLVSEGYLVSRAQRPFRQRFGHAGASAKPRAGPWRARHNNGGR